MSQSLTYISMLCVAAVVVLALFKARRPRELGKAWHIPWNGILFLGLLLLLMLVRHQLHLSGIELPARM